MPKSQPGMSPTQTPSSRPSSWRTAEPRDLFEYGAREALIWTHAVEAQANRVLEDAGSDQMDRQVDAYLLLLAARNVHRAGKMALDELDPVTENASYQSLKSCLGAFSVANKARDVLEHFDEYLAGRGQLQQPNERNARNRFRDDDLADQHTTFYGYDGGQRFQLHVVVNGNDHIVDVDDLREASHDVLTTLWNARRDRQT